MFNENIDLERFGLTGFECLKFVARHGPIQEAGAVKSIFALLNLFQDLVSDSH